MVGDALERQQEKPSVFFSYTHEDAPLAKILIDVLQSNFKDLHIFDFAASDLIGTDWQANVRSSMNRANAVICLLGPDSIRKQWILFEFGAAWFAHGHKNLLPIYHSGVRPEHLGHPLNSINGLSIDDGDFGAKFVNSINAGLSQLIRAPEEARFRQNVEAALATIKLSRQRYHLFLAAPLADSAWFDMDAGWLARVFGSATASADDARRVRDDIEQQLASAVEELQRQGLKVRYAGLEPPSERDDDRERKVADAITQLRLSDKFALVLTTMRATGALCEAGFAHALGIESTYYIRDQVRPSTFLKVAKTSIDEFSRGAELKRKIIAKYGNK